MMANGTGVIKMDRKARAQYIWCILKSYMLDECSLDCAAVSSADEKNLINEIFNSIPEESPSAVGGKGKSESLQAANPDFKQVFDFLTSIEGAGYGGMAVFEIARETMRRMCEDRGAALQAMAGVYLSHYKPVGYISRDGLTALRSDNDATICCDNSARGFDVPVYLAGEPASPLSNGDRV